MRSPQREYGWDATMFHFSPDTGEIENGEVRFQVKATDALDHRRQNAVCAVQTKDLHYWYWEDQQIPFVLILYDAQLKRAYWIHVRDYVDRRRLQLDPDQKQVHVQIPWSNKVTVKAIDRFRMMSLSRMAQDG